MKEFLDTSVLIAAFLGDHPHHEASAELFSRADRKRSSCAAHSLAEAYSTLTRLPVKPAIAPEQAMLFLQDARQRLSAIALDEADYYDALDRAARARVAGGRLYDCLLLECAVKAKADAVFTWNLNEFRRLRPDLAAKIRTP